MENGNIIYGGKVSLLKYIINNYIFKQTMLKTVENNSVTISRVLSKSISDQEQIMTNVGDSENHNVIDATNESTSLLPQSQNTLSEVVLTESKIPSDSVLFQN